MASLPYSANITSYADIQALERDIRQLLRCKGNTCAFLQSAEYKNLTFAMTRKLGSMKLPVLPVEHKIHIPHSNLVMHVSHDMKICIQAVTSELVEEDATAFVEEHRGSDVSKKRRRV
jgi:hypothetical protein